MFQDVCPGFFTVEHFCEIFDNSFIGCIVVDGETLRPIGVNQAYCAMLGISRHEFLSIDLSINDSEIDNICNYFRQVAFPSCMKYGHSDPVLFRHVVKATGEMLYLKMQCFMAKSAIMETHHFVILTCSSPAKTGWEQKDDSKAISIDRNGMGEAQLLRQFTKLKLTQTEIKVCLCLLRLKNTKEIADELGISIATVNTHRRNIRVKLGLKGEQKSLYHWLMQHL